MKKTWYRRIANTVEALIAVGGLVAIAHLTGNNLISAHVSGDFPRTGFVLIAGLTWAVLLVLFDYGYRTLVSFIEYRLCGQEEAR